MKEIILPKIDKPNTAFIIGNGVSRNQIDLKQLEAYGTIYGCNAIYRDYSPEAIFAVDQRMIDELVESSYPNEKIYVRRYSGLTANVNQIPGSGRGICSGVAAVRTAVHWGYEKIVLIGHDLSGINGKVNNVYTGTRNYVKPGHREIRNSKWVQQLTQTFMANPNVLWERVVDENCLIPEPWPTDCKVKHLSVEDFLSGVSTGSYYKGTTPTKKPLGDYIDTTTWN